MELLPIQPIKEDSEGIKRFVANSIVVKLLETSNLDMNQIATMGFSIEEQEQFAQLIGYSLSGYSELHYVSNESYGTAIQKDSGKDELIARNEYLRTTIEETKRLLKPLVTELFNLHEDDLES